MLRELTRYYPIGNFYISGSRICDLPSLDMDDFATRARMVQQVDLSFPVILNEEGLVMDGKPTIIQDMSDGSYKILTVVLN